MHYYRNIVKKIQLIDEIRTENTRKIERHAIPGKDDTWTDRGEGAFACQNSKLEALEERLALYIKILSPVSTPLPILQRIHQYFPYEKYFPPIFFALSITITS